MAGSGTTLGKARYSLGHVSGGKLFYDSERGSFGSVGQAIAENRRQAFVPNRVIIEARDARRYGKVFGVEIRYLSPIDGAELNLNLR